MALSFFHKFSHVKEMCLSGACSDVMCLVVFRCWGFHF